MPLDRPILHFAVKRFHAGYLILHIFAGALETVVVVRASCIFVCIFACIFADDERTRFQEPERK